MRWYGALSTFKVRQIQSELNVPAKPVLNTGVRQVLALLAVGTHWSSGSSSGFHCVIEFSQKTSQLRHRIEGTKDIPITAQSLGNCFNGLLRNSDCQSSGGSDYAQPNQALIVIRACHRDDRLLSLNLAKLVRV